VEIDFSRSEALQCVKRLRLVQQMTHEIKKAGMKLQLDIRTNLAPISRFFVTPLYKICGLQPTRLYLLVLYGIQSHTKLKKDLK